MCVREYGEMGGELKHFRAKWFFAAYVCVCVSGVFLYAPLIFLLIQSCVWGGRIVARYVFSCAWCVISMLLAFLCQNIFIV